MKSPSPANKSAPKARVTKARVEADYYLVARSDHRTNVLHKYFNVVRPCRSRSQAAQLEVPPAPASPSPVTEETKGEMPKAPEWEHRHEAHPPALNQTVAVDRANTLIKRLRWANDHYNADIAELELLPFIKSPTPSPSAPAQQDDEQLIRERDEAEDAADKMASLILGEPIDWSDHQGKWAEAIESFAPSAAQQDKGWAERAAKVEPDFEFEGQFSQQAEINAYAKGFDDAKGKFIKLAAPSATPSSLSAQGDAADTRRLDWLWKNGRKVRLAIGYRGSSDSWGTEIAGIYSEFTSLRTAIDAAMLPTPPNAAPSVTKEGGE